MKANDKIFERIMKSAVCGGLFFSVIGFIATVVFAILHFCRLVYLRPYMPMTVSAFFGGIIIALIGIIGLRLCCKCSNGKSDNDNN